MIHCEKPSRKASLEAIAFVAALRTAGPEGKEMTLRDAAYKLGKTTKQLIDCLAGGLTSPRLQCRIERLIFGFERPIFCSPLRLSLRARFFKTHGFDPCELEGGELADRARALGFRFDGSTVRAMIEDRLLQSCSTSPIQTSKKYL